MINHHETGNPDTTLLESKFNVYLVPNMIETTYSQVNEAIYQQTQLQRILKDIKAARRVYSQNEIHKSAA